jgi:DNA-binding GntR family transcriptional regulator
MPIEELSTDTVRNRRTTPSMVAEVLRDAIIKGQLKGGEPLRQDELAARFGLSRIPIREALRQLEGEGLVTANPHRGAVVSGLSRKELWEICEIRIALETTALRLAIPHLDDRAITVAEGILTETEHETRVVEHWSKNNWRFHSTLYLPADRPRLLAMIKHLHDQVDRYLRLHVTMLNYKEKGQSEHWRLLEACRAGDTAAALATLESHIKAVGVLLSEYLADENAPS